MKLITLIASFVCIANIAISQDYEPSLAGMYESTSNSDWISLKENGTGRLCFYNDFMNLGCLSFTWTSDEDQIMVEVKDQMGYANTQWCYWSNKNGIINLDFPTLGPYLNFIKTR